MQFLTTTILITEFNKPEILKRLLEQKFNEPERLTFSRPQDCEHRPYSRCHGNTYTPICILQNTYAYIYVYIYIPILLRFSVFSYTRNIDLLKKWLILLHVLWLLFLSKKSFITKCTVIRFRLSLSTPSMNDILMNKWNILKLFSLMFQKKKKKIVGQWNFTWLNGPVSVKVVAGNNWKFLKRVQILFLCLWGAFLDELVAPLSGKPSSTYTYDCRSVWTPSNESSHLPSCKKGAKKKK